MKVLPVGAALFYAGGRGTVGRRDMAKLTVAFQNFAKAPKNVIVVVYTVWQSDKIPGCKDP
jgi:hypothetical protein